ncbi:MAG: hypothetical protein LUG89_02460 [Methanosphaera sp.]|nr:hypothetical protein [Methanosphaera sp.]
MVNDKDLIIRSNGEGKIYSIDHNEVKDRYSLPIVALVEQHYPYIKKEMDKENFNIPDDEECMIFKEVVHIDKVVGFSAYKGSNGQEPKALTLQYIYVIPDYRSNNLLVKDIIDTISLDRYVSIELPTHFMVQSLIDHDLAKVFDDRFVVSKIPFSVPMTKFSDEEKEYIKKEYNLPDPTGINRESSIYDLEYSAIVCPALDGSNSAYNPDDNSTKSLEDGYISDVLDVDDEYFDAMSKRDDDEIYTSKYFDRLGDMITNNIDAINELLS